MRQRAGRSHAADGQRSLDSVGVLSFSLVPLISSPALFLSSSIFARSTRNQPRQKPTPRITATSSTQNTKKPLIVEPPSGANPLKYFVGDGQQLLNFDGGWIQTKPLDQPWMNFVWFGDPAPQMLGNHGGGGSAEGGPGPQQAEVGIEIGN